MSALFYRCDECGQNAVGGCACDLDPPSYLPMQPREAPRVPDLCPDDARDERELTKRAKEACERALSQRLGSPTMAKAELVIDLEREGDGYAIVSAEVVITPSAPHNPETCRDPACDCMPF